MVRWSHYAASRLRNDQAQGHDLRADPAEVAKEKRAAEDLAVRLLPTESGPDEGPACPARYRPGMGLAAADGSWRV